MNLLKMFRREKRSTLSNPSPSLFGAFGVRKSTSGVTVNSMTALTYAAFYSAVRVISESVAGLPLILYERVGDRDRRRAMDHPAAQVMNNPNKIQSRFIFREASQVHLCTWGNSYAQIIRSDAFQPTELKLIEPSRIRTVEREGRVAYELDGGKKIIRAVDMLHVQNLGNGIDGYSPVRLAREQVGQGLAADRYGGRFFANNAAPGGVLSYPGQFETEDDIARLRASIESQSGGENRFKTLVLEEGMSWAPMSVPNDDAQWLESRRFELEEVARFFRVPPHMIGALDRATFNNIEHMAIEFVTHTLRPWLIRWEQEADRKLLEKDDQERFYFEHLVEGLLRGDTETRFAAYATAIQNGYMTRNEVRVRENLEIMEGLDEFLVPLNLGVVGSEQPPPDDEQDDEAERGRPSEVIEERDIQVVQNRSIGERQRAMSAFRAIFEDAANRSVGRETNSIKRAAKKYLSAVPPDPGGFVAWLRKFYTDDLPPFLREVFAPAFAAFSSQLLRVLADELGRGIGDVDKFLDSYLEAFATRYTIRNRIQLEQTVNKSGVADLAGAVAGILLVWRDKRPAGVARDELTKLNGAVSRVSYENAGIERLRWVNTGSETCPICTALNGRIVGVREAFAQEGDDIAGGPTQGGLRVSNTMKHPPAHQGCDCMIVAE